MIDEGSPAGICSRVEDDKRSEAGRSDGRDWPLDEQLLASDAALTRLAAQDPVAARVVELRHGSLPNL